jgi:drug/metabolite transporter (DMT)-like permease
MRAELQGLLLAGAAAITFDAGMVLLKIRGDRHPPMDRFRALVAYGTDPLWLLGLVLQPIGYGLFLWALNKGPLAVVQPVMSAGIVLFVLAAVVVLGERIHPAEWAAIAAVGMGLLLLGSSLGTGEEEAAGGTGGWVAAYSAACLLGAAAASTWARGRAKGVAWGVWSGVLLGLGSLWAKGLVAGVAAAGPGRLASALAADPYLYLTAAGNIVGFWVLLHALRDTRSGIVFALSSTLSNVVPIVGAMASMGERLPEGSVAATLRVASLILTLAGAAYLARFEPRTRRQAPHPV